MNKQAVILAYYQKYKLVLFPLAVIISSIILIFFIIVPQIGRLLSLNNNIQELNKKSSFLETKAEELNALDEEDLKGKLNLALVALPQETDFANLVGIIQNLTSQTQFSLVSFQTDKVDPKGELKSATYGLKLILSGPRETLETLINNIEIDARVMKVKSIEYTASAPNNPIDLSIGLDVYYSPVPATLGAIDAPLPKLSTKDQETIATLARAVQQPVVETFGPSANTPRGKANPFE